MLNLSGILALAIGLFFIYLLLSALTSYITEAISTVLRLRSKNLADAIQKLLEPSTQLLNGEQRLMESWTTLDEPNTESQNYLPDRLTKLNANFLKSFYEHPIILSLSKPNNYPSYISAQDFSITLLDLLMESRQGRILTPDQYLDELKKNIYCLNEDLRRTLLPLIEYAEIIEVDPDKRVAQVRQNIDQWYLTTIDRASGWYKNRVQKIGLVVGFLVAILLNADTINIIQILWTDTAVSQGMVEVAQDTTQKVVSQGLVEGAQDLAQQTAPLAPLEVTKKLGTVNFPLGWSSLRNSDGLLDFKNANLGTPIGVLSKFMGLLITALAISVGSSIWFDILNRLINLRSTGVKPST
jgi:hypothetical protein